MSHRMEQVAASLERALREVFARGFNDPRISGLLTITSVSVTPDLAHAFVNVSVLPEERAELSLHGLQSASKHIRREVGELVRARVMPDLVFRLDTSLKTQAKVMDALERAKHERDDSTTRTGWSAKQPDDTHHHNPHKPHAPRAGDDA